MSSSGLCVCILTYIIYVSVPVRSQHGEKHQLPLLSPLFLNVHPGGRLWMRLGLQGMVLPLDHLCKGRHLLESIESFMSKKKM